MSIRAFFKKKAVRNAICLALPLSYILYAISVATEDRYGVARHSDALYHDVDKEGIEKWLQKYEELEWFATAEPSEQMVYEMPSKLMFGKEIPSFDRVLLSLKVLNAIFRGKYANYLELVSEQPKQLRLDWNQFQVLQNQVKTAIENYKRLTPELVYAAIEFAVAMSEIGETETARKRAWVYEISTSDSRAFIEAVMEKHPEILPTYSKLKPEQQHIVKAIFTLVRFQEIADLRAGEEAFEKVKRSKILEEEPELFEFALLVYMCEIAGSLGDRCFCSAPWFTKYACQNFNTIRKAFYLLREKSAKAAAEYYLSERASLLGLDPGSPLNRVLTRVGGMMKLYTQAEGQILKETFLKFQPDELAAVVAQFDIARPKEMPLRMSGLNSLLFALRRQGHLGISEKDKLSRSVLITFPFVAKVLRERATESRKVHTLDFHKLIPLVAQDPSLLQDGKISIAHDGIVSLKESIHPTTPHD